MKLSLIAPAFLIASTLFACASNDEPTTDSSSSDVIRGVLPAPARKGESCGTGVTGIAVDCAHGLVCDDAATSAHAADQMGRCIDIVAGELGAGCGYGVTGIPLECKTGWKCADDGNAKPDQLGVCVRDIGAEGAACGRGLAPCGAGLVCAGIAPTDGLGKCALSK